MERLTNANHKELGFCAYVGQKNPYSIPIIIGELSAPPNADYSPNAILVDVFEHLAAYEDTGLEPEEISGFCSMAERAKMADLLRLEEYQEIGSIDHLQELAQAEKDGRLMVQKPPFPGDTIWIIERDEYEEPIEISRYMFFAFVGRAVIVSAFIDDSETLDETVEYHIEETSINYDTDLSVFHQNDCYLTHEEAEAALKKRESDEERGHGIFQQDVHVSVFQVG